MKALSRSKGRRGEGFLLDILFHRMSAIEVTPAIPIFSGGASQLLEIVRVTRLQGF
jgi:hypothetical protein